MFGMNYERYEPKCNNNHTLLAYRGFPYEHGQVSCDVCSEKNLQDMDLFYHCRQCKYDMCKACFLQRAKYHSQKLRCLIHKCELSFVNTSLHWKCDAPGQAELTDDVCIHGQTDFGHGINTQRWRCQSCDFDVCLKCVLVYGHTPIEDVKEQEVDYAYFLLSTNLYQKQTKVLVNRFVNKDKAYKMFERL